MISKIKKVIANPLISGSGIIFVGSFIANLFHYFFNLLMGRFLTVSEYGLLVTLSSIFALFGVFQSSFTNSFAKFSASYFAKERFGKIKELIKEGTKIVIVFSFVLLLLMLATFSKVAEFLHVNDFNSTIIIYLAVIFSIIYSLPYGLLQGKMKFVLLSVLNNVQALSKLALGVLFVVLGFNVFGALLGICFSTVIALLLGYFLIKKYYIGVKEEVIEEKSFIKDFTGYGTKYFFSALGMALLSGTDIILVRHFFTDVVSGQYAALSLMGKAIFYFTVPINSVFFPLIAHKKEKQESLFQTLALAIGLITLMSAGFSFIYFTFPDIVLKIFFPAKGYQVLSSYLGFFSLYIMLFSIASIFNNFFLSIGKTEVYKFINFAALLQIVLFFLFHESLYQIIGVLSFTSFLLLLVFLIYYLANGRD